MQMCGKKFYTQKYEARDGRDKHEEEMQNTKIGNREF